MKRLTLFILFCTVILSAQTQYELLDTQSLGERELKIQLPRNYEENTDTFYPLILTLDGDYLFEIVAGNVDYTAYWDDMPEAIVVGVNQIETRADDLYVSDNTFFPVKSGAQFFEFIGDELITFLEDNYRVNEFRVAVGHGASANFVQFFAFKNKPIFQAYISISPSLSPYMSDNLTALFGALKSPLFFYMSTASEDFKTNRTEALELNTKVEAIESAQLYYAFDNFQEANHYALASRSIPQALDHIFLVYQPISRAEYKKHILPLETSPVDYLLEKYNTIEKLFGIEKQILMNDFRAISTAIEKNKSFDYFKDLAKLARDAYPETLLSNYYMGRFFEATGNIRKAIKAYQEAYIYLEIDGITKDDLLNRADRLKAEFGY